MDKVLTVSIAAYNISDSICMTLDSLVKDSDFPDKTEIIIVDDGSKDETAAKAEEYVKRYPETFKLISKANGGYGSTINESVKEAHGKYFKQLDGGDEYLTENLSDFVSFLSSHDADIIISPYIKYYQKDDKEEIIDEYASFDKSKDYDISEINFDKRLWMHGLAFKTEVWKKYGRLIPERCFYTDMEYVLYPFLGAESIAFFDKPVYKYYLQCEGQSVSEEGIKKHYKDAVKMMWDICEVYVEAKKSDSVPDSSKHLLEISTNHAVAFAYTSFVILGKEYYKELKEIDAKLKNDFPSVYENTGKVKRIKLMRNTGFGFHGLYRKLIN